MHNLSRGIKSTRIENSAVAGTSTLTSDAVDMAGFRGARFVAAFGTITTSAVTSVKLQQSSDDGVADSYGDIEGSDVTVADDDDNQLVVIDIYNPQKRYLKCIILRATQNSVFDGCHVDQYGAYELPTTDDTATVVERNILVAPAEGTA
jgi:hypothetical protein